MSVLAILLLAFAGGDDFRAGLEAFRSGKYREALEAFTRAEEAAGPDASPELLFDKALSALASGDPHTAEAAAEKAAARGGPSFARARDFLRGNVAFSRCEEGEKAAEGNAEPSSLDKAIELAESARAAWVAAASAEPEGRDDAVTAAASRNAERAIRKIEELKKKKEEAEKKQKEQQKDQKKDDPKDQKKDQQKKDDPSPQSQPQKDEPPQSQPQQEPKPDEKDKKDDESKQEPKDQPKESQQQPKDPKQLPAEQVQRLLDKLDEKEKQRQQLLRMRARTVKVPKDW